MSQKIKQMYRKAISKGAKGIQVPKGKKGVHTSAFHRAVTEIAKKGNVDNPYAVAMKSLGARKAVRAGHRAIAEKSRYRKR